MADTKVDDFYTIKNLCLYIKRSIIQKVPHQKSKGGGGGAIIITPKGLRLGGKYLE